MPNKKPRTTRFLLDLFGIDQLHIANYLLIRAAQGKGFPKPIIINGYNNVNELEKFALLIENVADEELKKGCWYHPRYIPAEDIKLSKADLMRYKNGMYLHLSQLNGEYYKSADCLTIQTKTVKNSVPWAAIFKEILLLTTTLKELK